MTVWLCTRNNPEIACTRSNFGQKWICVAGIPSESEKKQKCTARIRMRPFSAFGLPWFVNALVKCFPFNCYSTPFSRRVVLSSEILSLKRACDDGIRDLSGNGLRARSPYIKMQRVGCWHRGHAKMELQKRARATHKIGHETRLRCVSRGTRTTTRTPVWSSWSIRLFSRPLDSQPVIMSNINRTWFFVKTNEQTVSRRNKWSGQKRHEKAFKSTNLICTRPLCCVALFRE